MRNETDAEEIRVRGVQMTRPAARDHSKIASEKNSQFRDESREVFHIEQQVRLLNGSVLTPEKPGDGATDAAQSSMPAVDDPLWPTHTVITKWLCSFAFLSIPSAAFSSSSRGEART